MEGLFLLEISLQNEVPYELRLATALLVKLGRRKEDKLNKIKSGTTTL